MTKDNGGPAFPFDAGDAQNDWYVTEQHPGMSLRDWFAGQAMTGWLASYSPEDMAPVPEKVAKFFYSLADAMLAEREK